MDATPHCDIFRRRLIRGTLCALLAVVLIGWGLTDIRNRGRWNPATPLNHMTDLTVYTEAGAAFFDGRDPYAVANHRGWHYLYPPLLAIVLAPLSKIDSQWQVVVWYFINLAIAWGCCYESWRLLCCISPNSTTSSTAESLRIHRSAPAWLIAAAAGAMLLPALNCLQRGQVGLLVAYFVLLGLRLVLASRGWLGWMAGGAALALAITVKLTPLMPALFLLAMLALPVVLERFKRSPNGVYSASRHSASQFTATFGGLAGGLLLFLLLLPAAAVGWSANWHHLNRFVDLIVLNHDMGGENDLTYHSIRNQSLVNAAYRLGNWVAFESGHGPDDAAAGPESPMPMDAPIVHHLLSILRLALLALLAAVGWRAARRGTSLDLAAAYGAACVATLLVSPLSWAHHYPIEAAGVLIVPLWFWQHGRVRTAAILAASSCGLMWAHYLFLDVTGRAGVLGLGTTVWFMAAAGGMLRAKPANGAVAIGQTERAAA